MSRAGAIGRALGAELRVAFMTAMQYRASFLGNAVLALLAVVATLLPLFVVFGVREGVAGWTADEAMLVVGFFIALEGIMRAFVEPNLRAVVEQVRDGSFDFVLLKPIDAQLQVSLHRTAPTKLPHALAGLVVVGVAAARLPEPPGAMDWVLAAVLFGAGVVALHALFTMVISTSFWFVRIDNLSHLLQSALETGRWPVGFYQGAVRIFLTVILPVGVMTTWPALALRGALGPGAAALGVGVALGFALAARLVWLAALRSYSSASS